MAEKARVLIFGAHPDDCDVKAGGTATLCARAGHTVKMVSVTNGDAGHHAMGGAPLAWRRRKEAAAAGRCFGVEYITLDNHDGELTASLPVRRQLIAEMRSFRPDVVICPRPWDYHPDHRATGELVVDAVYLSTVPNVVSNVPHLPSMPVVLYMWDHFTRPCPVRPDIVIDITPVIQTKLDALHCHTSQVYEWLPYNRNALDQVPEGDAERRAFLEEWYMARFANSADRYRDKLIQRYGNERGKAVQHIEVFEISEYGSPLSEEEAQRIFPF